MFCKCNTLLGLTNLHYEYCKERSILIDGPFLKDIRIRPVLRYNPDSIRSDLRVFVYFNAGGHGCRDDRSK